MSFLAMRGLKTGEHNADMRQFRKVLVVNNRVLREVRQRVQP
jgi:hypothetical protein